MKKLLPLFISLFIISLANNGNGYAQEVEQDDYETAKSYYLRGRYEKARVIFVALADDESKTLYAQCLTLFTEQKLAQEALDASKYNTGIRYCEEILKVNPTDEITQDIKKRCIDGIKKLQSERQQLFEEAVNTMSEQKLQSFKEKYAKQKEWVEKADVVLADLPLWKSALKANTKHSYQQYLISSSSKMYEKEAKYKIGDFECEESWELIKDSRNIEDFTTFKKKFSAYKSHFDEADARIDLLNGVKYYNDGDLYASYLSFSKAKITKLVSFLPEDKYKFKKSTEYARYKDLGQNASIEKLKSYIKAYPSSDYCDEANNRIAIMSADLLSAYSPKSSYDNVRKYATNERTKTYVESKISAANKGRKEIIREKYGKMLSIGIDGAYDSNDRSYGLHIGSDIRLGRCSNWINFTLGANYSRISIYHLKEKSKRYYQGGYDLIESVNFPAHLKFNIIPIGEKTCRFFIGCGVEYGIPFSTSLFWKEENNSYYDDYYGSYATYASEKEHKIKLYESNTLAYIPEFGFSWKHFALDFYYKKYRKLYNKDAEEEYRDVLNLKSHTLKRDWFAGIRFIGYF
ncbi:MAG: hypothetical protein K6E73_00070 [Bacteroidales bacterium]|nr:hypothetical protein [Bacteroidales bacterium]